MKKTAFNPYLPTWEYVPDGEPHVFGDRVYVYGSHDEAGATAYCVGDYVTWSAPVDDLSDWRYEGVIFRKGQDPMTEHGKYNLFAPDVCEGPDGRYYLYTSIWMFGYVSVAVSDGPAGPFSYVGTVAYEDGFDPAVLCEDGRTYLYYGFCPDKHYPDMGPQVNEGAYMVELAPDMRTAITEPVCVALGWEAKDGTPYEGHPFFEASSIRHIGDWYYFVYSSYQGNELCYGMAKSPAGPFEYKGVIVSNCDLGFQGNETPRHADANNHGSILTVDDDHYIFYHRHTHNTHFSRQGCAERIAINEDGTIDQVECTSCGLNDGWVEPRGTFTAAYFCNLEGDPQPYQWEEEDAGCEHLRNQYVRNLREGGNCTFKRFDFDAFAPSKVGIRVRGAAGTVTVSADGAELARIELDENEFWHSYEAPIVPPMGIHALTFAFDTPDEAQFDSFTLA